MHWLCHREHQRSSRCINRRSSFEQTAAVCLWSSLVRGGTLRLEDSDGVLLISTYDTTCHIETRARDYLIQRNSLGGPRARLKFALAVSIGTLANSIHSHKAVILIVYSYYLDVLQHSCSSQYASLHSNCRQCTSSFMYSRD